jgi:uncharacterized membrane protein
VNKSRTEAFSDGVFAVAATLLVFTLQVPDVKSGLAKALVDEWPSYAAYAVSFGTILVIWVNHHAVLDSMKTFDRPVLFLNGLLLMTVAAIPFPTALLAHYLQAGHDQRTAAVAYGITMSSMAFAFTLINLYARNRGYRTGRFNLIAFSTGQLMYPLATVVALVNAYTALAIYAGTMLFYVALPLVREARAKGESDA